MARASRALGYSTSYSLHVLRDADHDFDELVGAGLAQDLFDCLFAGNLEPSAVEL
jgi:hypothetical protein